MSEEIMNIGSEEGDQVLELDIKPYPQSLLWYTLY